MKNKFDYQSVPYGFAHCFHSQCIHKEECLHHLAAINCTSQYPTLSIINPNRIPADTTECPYFRKAQKYRVAWGIRHLDGDPWLKTRIDDKEHEWLWKPDANDHIYPNH